MPNLETVTLHYPYPNHRPWFPYRFEPTGLRLGRWFAPDRSTRVVHIGRGVRDLRDAARCEAREGASEVSPW